MTSRVIMDSPADRRRMETLIHEFFMEDESRPVPHYSILMCDAMRLVERVREDHDGHFTLLAFTTGWKSWIGLTPHFGPHGADQENLDLMPTCATAAEAICWAVLTRYCSEHFEEYWSLPVGSR